jgi:hypothetical protein
MRELLKKLTALGKYAENNTPDAERKAGAIKSKNWEAAKPRSRLFKRGKLVEILRMASSSSEQQLHILSSGKLLSTPVSAVKPVRDLDGIDEIRGYIAVLITHVHSVTFWLKTLTKKINTVVCATAKVLEHLIENNMLGPGTKVMEVGLSPFTVAGMRITAFPPQHDSIGSVGYRIELENERTIGIATDLGTITDEVVKGISGCELVLLESNYDEDKLWSGSYPFVTKKRIASDFGHLSNECSARFARLLIQKVSSRLILAHLSKENKTLRSWLSQP